MKIVCDSCGTKYSISDDKVRGKVFKIRCKKCSHIIVVRGNETASAAAPAAPAAAVEAGGWHLVVDGDQVGPVSDADVRGRIERGEINAETYVWKEGFADWLKLSAIPDFAHLVQPAEGGVFADGSGSGGGNGSAEAPAANGGGLFGAATASAGDEAADVFGGLAPAASRGGGGGDLFASPAVTAKSSSASSGWPAQSAAAAPHDGGRVENLTGQRHENSVLFSLSNLQSLATASPAARPLASTTAPTSEGSGLIDIRAMAASTLGSSSSSSPSFGGGGDDFPAFGSFSPAAPVLLALPSSSGPPKWIYPVIGIAVLLVGAIGVMAYKILAKPVASEVATAPVAAAPAEPAKGSAPVAANPPPVAKAPTKIAEENLPPREAPKSAEAKSEPKGEHHKGHGEKADRGDKGEKSGKESGKGGKPAAAAVAAAAPAPVPVEKKPVKGSLDDLLEGALSHKPAAAAKPRVTDDDTPHASAPASSGPLAKSAVVSGMNSVKGKISDCYNQFKVPGMAMVNVVIGKNGHVSSATVSGKFAGTPTGSCVEKAVKSASFPPSDGLTTPYPFQLK
jgi:predicted Zn finger-like uncharacterized protein